MKSHVAAALALTLSASFLAAAPAQAQTAFQLARQQSEQRQTAEIAKYYLPDVQRSVSGYFNTLNIRGDQVKEGLTIPWVASNQETNWAGYSSFLLTQGFAVATGKTVAPKGCPEFKVVAFNHVVRDTSRIEANFGICP